LSTDDGDPDGNLPEDQPESWSSALGSSSSFLGFGAQLAGSMLFYVVAGYLLDRWLGTSPWLIVIGAIVGMIAFFYQLARIAKRMQEESDRRKRERA